MDKKEFGSFKKWWMAIRPKTLPASIVPVFMGIAIAVKHDSFHIFLSLITIICAILIQIGTNLVNDYSDFKKGTDDKHRIGPIRVTQAGLVTEKQMKYAILFVLFFIITGSVFLILRGGIPILIIGILSLLAGYFYTGGPSPYGYLGFGDIFVLVFFGPVSLAGAYFVQTLTIDPVIIIAGFGPGLISVAILAVNNIRDINNDRRTGKRTLVVRFGRNFGIFEYIFSMIIASLIPFIIGLLDPAYLLSSISAIIIFSIFYPYKILKTTEDGEKLNRLLGFTGIILIIYGILFSIGLFIR